MQDTHDYYYSGVDYYCMHAYGTCCQSDVTEAIHTYRYY